MRIGEERRGGGEEAVRRRYKGERIVAVIERDDVIKEESADPSMLSPCWNEKVLVAPFVYVYIIEYVYIYILYIYIRKSTRRAIYVCMYTYIYIYA